MPSATGVDSTGSLGALVVHLLLKSMPPHHAGRGAAVASWHHSVLELDIATTYTFIVQHAASSNSFHCYSRVMQIDVLPCKFMSADGWGRTSDAVQCADWCLRQGATIISASWSCGEEGNPPLEEAVARIQQAGALLVVSAGNQAANMAVTPYFPQAYSARYDNLLVVAASDEYDEHIFFSNYDPKTVHLSSPGHW
jgi:hypothetical protein